jgi:hypothetical protein
MDAIELTLSKYEKHMTPQGILSINIIGKGIIRPKHITGLIGV